MSNAYSHLNPKADVQTNTPSDHAEPWKSIYANQPFVRHLTLGDSRATRDFALCLDRLMQRAILNHQPGVRLTLKKIAEQARVSYASAKRAMTIFKARGWVEYSPENVLIVNWQGEGHPKAHQEPARAQTEPPEDQFEPAYKGEKKTLRESVHGTQHQSHAETPACIRWPAGPGGWHGELQERGNQASMSPLPPPEPSLASRAITLLVEAGANRAGAVAAVNAAAQEGRLSLEHVQRIIAATLAKKHRLQNPGGMMCKALRHREAGHDLLREHKQRKPPQGNAFQPEASVPSRTKLPTHISQLLDLASIFVEPSDLKFMIDQKRFTPEQVRDFANRYPRYSRFLSWLAILGLHPQGHVHGDV